MQHYTTFDFKFGLETNPNLISTPLNLRLVKFDIFDASISSVKYFRISINLASEILERTIYLFFNFATLVTFQKHSSHRNLLAPLHEPKLKRAK